MIEKTFDIVMVTTFIVKDHIHQLLESIQSNNSQLSILLVLVHQHDGSADDFVFNFETGDNTAIVLNSKKCGLSKARNLAINYVLQHNYKARFIMFPDDDSVFDKTFFERFNTIVQPHTNYLTPILVTNTQTHYKKFDVTDNKVLGPGDFVLVGSPNMIINFNAIERGIKFDEILGVGGKYGSSEDVDFYFKNIALYPFKFTHQLYTYHPTKFDTYAKMTFKEIIKRFKGYSAGFIYVMLRYKRPQNIFMILIRSVGAALHSLYKLKFKLFFAYVIQFFIRVGLIFSIWFNNRRDFIEEDLIVSRVEVK